MSLAKYISTQTNRFKLQEYDATVKKINSYEKRMSELSDDDLFFKSSEFRSRFCKGETLNSILPEAFAVTKEAAWRTLNIKPFDVQLAGGIILHSGKIAEMQTGEGKTLVASLPAYLNAITGNGVHIVTVNDYLARRDAESIGKIFKFLGLRVGLIQQGMSNETRKDNYNSDVIYVTNSELGFDYLRDNMATSLEEIVQNSFFYCIIDEVDSILIDEARTPLVISGPVKASTEYYIKATKLSSFLKRNNHYEVEEKSNNIILTENGITICEQALNTKDIYDPSNPWAHYIYNALKAKELYLRDVHYIVKNNEVILVDEFTGRIMEERRWSDGLHQAVEAKEDVSIQEETQTLASITYQNLFLLYPKLSGMTGTAKTEENEFEKIYKLEVTPVPTNRPMIRKDFSDLIYRTEHEKWKAIAKECSDMFHLERPVLVGTTSVEKSELLAALLSSYKIPYNILNAKPENIEREAKIIAQAGGKSTITIATNMAGRGTDILLGGNLNYTIKAQLNKLFTSISGDKKLHRDIDKYIEIEFSKLCDTRKSIIKDYINNLLQLENYVLEKVPEKLAIVTDSILDKKENLDSSLITLRDLYQFLKEIYEPLFQKENQAVIESGGLHVIGTERHDSRRIDNQLRGRSGRQGDPGSSRFFLSLQDHLIRIFGGEQISNLMETLQLDENVPIESNLLSRSLNSAQKKVENHYYDLRKQLFEYDEVLNSQRQAIYLERRRILQSQNLKSWILSYAKTVIEEITDIDYRKHPHINHNHYNLLKRTQDVIGIPSYLFLQGNDELSIASFKSSLYKQLCISYNIKELQLTQTKKGVVEQIERYFLLKQIDNHWKDHLQQMGFLREYIGWRGYAQKDPLIEYKNEAHNLFLGMAVAIRHNVVYYLFRSRPLDRNKDVVY